MSLKVASKKLNHKKCLVIATILYCGILFISNWSILLGENLMKWDIWDAHFPAQVITSDAIHAGTFPIWNPLFNYGTPYYAMVGTPVWYPITLMLDVVGYNTSSPAWEYYIHLVIAAIGMYQLSSFEIKDNSISRWVSREITAFISGLLYVFSGPFFSNAQHIMIIISMAWLPWILYNASKYIYEKNIVYLFTQSMCLSFVLLGGYPELFFDCFIVLIVWNVINISEQSITKRIVDTIKNMILTGFLTAFASAITLIPFFNLMGQITRGSGQTVMSYPFSAMLSAIFPVTEELIGQREVSMESIYLCSVVFLILPFIIRNDNKKQNGYFMISIICLLLMFGENSFLHSLFYRFIPMYSTFRFASLWRVYVILFLLLSSTGVLLKLFDGDFEYEKLIASIRRVICVLIPIVILVWIYVSGVQDDSLNIGIILESVVFLCLILGMYYYALIQRKNNYYYNVILVGVILFECLSISYKYFPVTVATYNQTEYLKSEAVRESVDGEKKLLANRNTSVEFNTSLRSNSGLNSKNIAYNKNFDEEGYLSIKLSSTEYYKNTTNRGIIINNPEIYFTNDVIDIDDIEFEKWLSNADTSPSQIVVNGWKKCDSQGDLIFEPVNISHFGFNTIEFEYDAKTDGVVTVLQSYYPGWNLYVDGVKKDICEVNKCFIGVPLDKGLHIVKLKFEPVDLKIGGIISLLFYVIFAWILIFSHRKNAIDL